MVSSSTEQTNCRTERTTRNTERTTRTIVVDYDDPIANADSASTDVAYVSIGCSYWPSYSDASSSTTASDNSANNDSSTDYDNAG